MEEWNINKGFGDVLTGLIDQVNQAAYQGDVLQWFNALRILFRNVAGHKKMKVEKVKKIDELLLGLRDKVELKESITEQGKAHRRVELKHAKRDLDEVNIMLITEMHKAGLIFPVRLKKAEFAALDIN